MAFKKPKFGVDTSAMSAELPLLPGGQAWAAEVISAGINEKAPLNLQVAQEWDDTLQKFVEVDKLIISCPFGFGFGVKFLSKKAQQILGRDEPKMFHAGIRLHFGEFELDKNGEPTDESYNWIAATGTAIKEILNAVELGDVNYAELVPAQDTIEDLEQLYDILGISSELQEVYKRFPEEQVIYGLNAVMYWRDFFSVMAKDIENRQVMVTVEKGANKKNKAIQENRIYAGTAFAPSSGLTKYKPGSENDLD